MKFVNEGHLSQKEIAKEISDVLGDGDRMSKEEKEAFLAHSFEKGYYTHTDFVTVGDYAKIFRSLTLDGKTVVNVGAGYSLGSENHLQRGMSRVAPKVHFIPVDARFDMAKSWFLFDTNNQDKQDDIILNPLVADGRRLPFNDASVDGYTSVNLVNIPVRGLEAEKFVKGLLAEAYRVLKESGFILINSFGYMLQLKDGVLVGVNNNINPSSIITIDKLKELLCLSGFVDIERLPVDQNLVREVERSNRDMLRKSDPRIDTACVECGGFLAFKKKGQVV